MRHASRRERGVVLLIVLFFSLLLTSAIATFMRRTTIDAMIARNREAAAAADALARGGIRLATALLLEDRAAELASGVPLDGPADVWWIQTRDLPITTPEGATLRLQVEDAGARLNLNALFNPSDGTAHEHAQAFLEALLEKVIDEMEIPPGENLYDARELAANLIDWVDADDLRLRGGPEDAYYHSQVPPYRAANQPLLSVDELRMVEGFDGRLVEALRPYVTVYPFVLGAGINLNTAPPHVLALLFFDDGVELQLADEDTIREILKVVQDGGMLCPEGGSSAVCTPIRQVVTNAIFPPPSFRSDVFTVTAEAAVGEVTRRVEAVIDRGPTTPEILVWRAR